MRQVRGRIAESMQVKLFDAAREYELFSDELGAAAQRVLASGQYILGPEVARLEEDVAAYLGVPFAVGVASGTDALSIALRALGIGSGDSVLVPSFTFFATASAVLGVGATPVPVDIEPRTFNIDVQHARAVLEGKSPAHTRLGWNSLTAKAIVPVHLFGQPADMHELRDLAKEFNLVCVEDAAQAFGGRYEDEPVGGMGDAAGFSFFPTKNLGGYGDGGLVATNREEIYEKAKLLRAHGAVRKYEHHYVGMNSRLDPLQAALLSVKLKHVDELLDRRISRARAYEDGLSGTPIGLPLTAPNRTHTFHQYVIRIPPSFTRDDFANDLAERGVETAIHYPVPLHLQKALEHLGYQPGDLPESEQASSGVLSLPISPTLDPEEQSFVISTIGDILARNPL